MMKVTVYKNGLIVIGDLCFNAKSFISAETRDNYIALHLVDGTRELYSDNLSDLLNELIKGMSMLDEIGGNKLIDSSSPTPQADNMISPTGMLAGLAIFGGGS